MRQYGLPYMGSKSKIAESIINTLPSGKRLVDLFGGGGAISHCAMVSGKWQSILYNDKEQLIVDLFRDALNGKYDNYQPEFITREKFFELKEKDGYVKYIWSFGNNGQGYMFAKDLEHSKHIAHDFVVFGKLSPELEQLLPNIDKYVKGTTWAQRRIEFCRYADLINNQRLQQLERLEQLQRLAQTKTQQVTMFRPTNIEFTCMSYEEYNYQNGDVVYCDIPYIDAHGYGEKFNHKAFFKWVDKQPYDIYISNYDNDMLNAKYECVYKQPKMVLITTNIDKGRNIAYECIYLHKGGYNGKKER